MQKGHEKKPNLSFLAVSGAKASRANTSCDRFSIVKTDIVAGVFGKRVDSRQRSSGSCLLGVPSVRYISGSRIIASSVPRQRPMSESASIFDRDASSRPSYGGITSRAPYISNLSSESSFTHDVEPGDTLQGIALKYGVKVRLANARALAKRTRNAAAKSREINQSLHVTRTKSRRANRISLSRSRDVMNESKRTPVSLRSKPLNGSIAYSQTKAYTVAPRCSYRRRTTAI